MAAGTLHVNIKADTKNLETGLKKSKRETKSAANDIKRSMSGVTGAFKAASLAAVAMTAATVAVAAKTVKAASDFEEISSKFNVVFSGMEEQAGRWADTLNDSFLMSQTESKKFLSSIQDLLVPMGMAAGEAGKMSFEVTKLAADLGSFNNLPTAQVIGDIQSALVGNYETMKKYGVVLNSTVVKEKALAMGLAETSKELTAGNKAQAAYELILKSSAAALGDVARTSDSYANQLKQLTSNYEDIKVSIGQGFLPVMTELLKDVNDWIKANEDLLKQDLKYWAETGAEALRVLADMVKSTLSAFKEFDEWLSGKAPRIADPIDRLNAELEQAQDHLAMLQRLSKGWNEELESPAVTQQREKVELLMAKLDALQYIYVAASDAEREFAQESKNLANALAHIAPVYEKTAKAAEDSADKTCAANKKALTCAEKRAKEEERIGREMMAAQAKQINMNESLAEGIAERNKKNYDQMEKDLEAFMDKESQLYEFNAQEIIEFRQGMTDDMANIFDDYLYNVLTGQIDDFGDMFEELFDSILKMFLRMISQMVAEWMASGIIGMLSGQGTGGFAASGLGKLWSGASAASSVSGMAGGPTASSVASALASYLGLSSAKIAPYVAGGAYQTLGSATALSAAVAEGTATGLAASTSGAGYMAGTGAGSFATYGATGTAGAGAGGAAVGGYAFAAIVAAKLLGEYLADPSARTEAQYRSSSGDMLTLTSFADSMEQAIAQLNDPAWVKTSLDAVQQYGKNFIGDMSTDAGMGGAAYAGYADTIGDIFRAMDEVDLDELAASTENGQLQADAMAESIGSLGDKLTDVYTSLEIEAEVYGDGMAQLALQMGNSVESFDAFVDASLGYDAAMGDSATLMNMASAAAHGNADAYQTLVTSLESMGMTAEGAASAANQMMAVLKQTEQQFNNTDFNLQASATIDVEVQGAATATADATAYADNQNYAAGGLLEGGSGRIDDLYLGMVNGKHIVAQGGEFIMNAKATRKNIALLKTMNAETYANGGSVDWKEGPTTDMKGWEDADIDALTKQIEALNNVIRNSELTGYQQQFDDIEEKYKEIFADLKKAGASEEDRFKAELAKSIELMAIEEKRQASLKSLMEYYDEANEGLDAYNQSLKDESDKYKKAVEDAKKLGATEEELGKIRQGYLAKHGELIRQQQEAIDDFMSTYDDIIATSGMSDYEKQVYDLNKQFDEAKENAIALGVTENDLAKIEEARRIELEKLADTTEDATDSVFTNLADVLKEIEDFGIQKSVVGSDTVGHAEGGIATTTHFIGEAGAEAFLPLRSPKQINHIEDKLDALLHSAGTGDVKVAVYIGNEKLDSRIEVISDRIATKRQRRNVQGRMLYDRVN